MSDRAEDENSSLDLELDALLGKYGSSKASVQLGHQGESSTEDCQEEGNREEYTSQFLREIRERAQILSRNAAKSRKAALQHVVSDDSHRSKAATGTTSLNMFVDVIRRADISEESQAEAATPPSSEDNLTGYSNDDLLPQVIPLDSAPWEEDTLNVSHDYYQGLQIEPWGKSTTESYGDDNDSDDSDSTSEELIQSDNDNGIVGDVIDGGCDDRISAQDSKHSKPYAGISSAFDVASYATTFTDVNGENEHGESLDQNSQFWPQGSEGTCVMGFQGKDASEESDSDEENEEDEDDEELEKERRFNEDDIAVALQDESLPLDNKSSNLQSNSTERFEEFKMVTETDEEVPGSMKESQKEDGLVDYRLVMRRDVDVGTEEVKDDGITETVDFNPEIAASPRRIQESDINIDALAAADIPFVNLLEDGIEVTGRKSLETMEEETKTDDMASRQQRHSTEDPQPAMLDTNDKPVDSTSEVGELQACIWNQEANDNTMDLESFILPEVSSDTELDADVQERVSSFLDEMLGGEVLEERLEEDSEGADDLKRTANQDLSPQEQSSFFESARETSLSKEVAKREKHPGRNELEEVWSSTRQEETARQVDVFSSLVIGDVEGLTDETDRNIPGEDAGSDTEEEELMQENLGGLENLKEEVQHGEMDEGVYLHQPDVDEDQSNTFKKSEGTTQPPSLRDTVPLPVTNQVNSTTKEAKSEMDIQDGSKQTLHSLERQTESSKPNRAGEPKQLFTVNWSREQHHTTQNAVKPKAYFEQARANAEQERREQLEIHPEKDPVNVAPFSIRLRHRPEQMAKVQTQVPVNQETLPDESPKAPGNVRSLIARFNSGSASASPVESPRSDRSFDWNVSYADRRREPRERLSSSGSSSSNPDRKTNSPQLPTDVSSGDSSHSQQSIPWMQEVRERRRRREQGTVWGKSPR